MNEKHEKECKIKEIALLKEKEAPACDIKELRTKYDI